MLSVGKNIMVCLSFTSLTHEKFNAGKAGGPQWLISDFIYR